MNNDTPALPQRYQTPKGIRTKEEIVAKAMNIASIEGLEGLTIGRLARETAMSKSGLFAHFGSKEGLQLATVKGAAAVFAKCVLEPPEKETEGLPRLFAMLSAWIAYVEFETFPGGCFFAAAASEFDGRPGPVRDLVASFSRDWLSRIDAEGRRAIALGHLEPSVHPGQLAFELHAYVLEANWAFQLLQDEEAFTRARKGLEERLRRAATPAGLRVTKTRRVLKTAGADVTSTER